MRETFTPERRLPTRQEMVERMEFDFYELSKLKAQDLAKYQDYLESIMGRLAGWVIQLREELDQHTSLRAHG